MKKTLLVALGLAFACAGALAAPEDAITKAGCNACHTKDKKLVGPSFKEIATKYKGQDVSAKLFDKVRKGGSGSFGPIPMSPNPPEKISDGDLKEVIAWILKQG
ncbi:MAG: c-type cytochrome [Rubrivivax sp.]